jgi:hypothetical protein
MSVVDRAIQTYGDPAFGHRALGSAHEKAAPRWCGTRLRQA